MAVNFHSKYAVQKWNRVEDICGMYGCLKAGPCLPMIASIQSTRWSICALYDECSESTQCLSTRL